MLTLKNIFRNQKGLRRHFFCYCSGVFVKMTWKRKCINLLFSRNFLFLQLSVDIASSSSLLLAPLSFSILTWILIFISCFCLEFPLFSTVLFYTILYWPYLTCAFLLTSSEQNGSLHQSKSLHTMCVSVHLCVCMHVFSKWVPGLNFNLPFVMLRAINRKRGSIWERIKCSSAVIVPYETMSQCAPGSS